MDITNILVLHDGFTVACEASCDCMGVFSNVHSSMFKLRRVGEGEVVDNLPEEK